MIRFSGMGYGELFGYGISGFENPIYSSLSQISGINPSTFSRVLKSQYNSTALNKSAPVNAKYGYNTLRYGTNTVPQLSTEASKLATAAKKLVSEGSENIFRGRDTYDPDKAFKAVSDFVTSYNDTVSALPQTGNVSVQTIGSGLIRMTGIMKKSLSMAGVNVSPDGKLSLDEETFKNADMDTIKSLFGGNNSYAKIVSSSAERIRSASILEQRLNIDRFYGKNGSFYNSLYSGYGFDGFF